MNGRDVVHSAQGKTQNPSPSSLAVKFRAFPEFKVPSYIFREERESTFSSGHKPGMETLKGSDRDSVQEVF